MNLDERIVKAHLIESFVNDAIQYASNYRKSLSWPKPNFRDGDCLFEAVLNGLANQPFNEVLENSPQFYREKWVTVAEVTKCHPVLTDILHETFD